MLPSLFRGTSHYPGLDRLASGPVPVISGTFIPRFSLQKAAASLLLSLRLPCLSKLTSLLRQTPCHIFRNGRHDTVILLPYSSLTRISFKKEPFAPCLTFSNLVSSSFNPAFAVLFSFVSPYYFSIGLR